MFFYCRFFLESGVIYLFTLYLLALALWHTENIFTIVFSWWLLRWSGGQACDESSIVGHVDVQHRSVCGGWDHGDSCSGVSDPPGQNKQEEEGRAQTTMER